MKNKHLLLDQVLNYKQYKHLYSEGEQKKIKRQLRKDIRESYN